MTNKLSYIFIVGYLFFSSVSCTKELEKINRNPNSAEVAKPDYLLTAAIKSVVDQYWGITRNSNPTSLFVQHWAMIQYTDPDRYIFTNNDFQSLWKIGYASILNLNKIIQLAEEEKNPNANYKGVALVLRSWVYSLLTDNFGDIPYRESVSIDKYLTPAYDAQKDVYIGVLEDLKTAAATLDPGGKAIKGDILYNNNISLWTKLANSLRLRIALRIADREPRLSQSVIEEIRGEGGPFIESNDEIAQLVYENSPNQNPISNYFDTRDDYRISKTMVDKLFELKDPRLAVYSSRTKDATPEGYIGLPNGLLVGDASNYGFSKTSRPGLYFLEPHAPAVIFSYAELLFDRAEAAARGFTNEDPADLYVQAIRASLEQYRVPDAAISQYLQQAAVTYKADDFRKSIGEQKWIALFGQGMEAFAEWRRLDYPQLSPAVSGVLEGKMPMRFIYPGIEQSLNGPNYKNAIANQGPDRLTTRLWFDTE